MNHGFRRIRWCLLVAAVIAASAGSSRANAQATGTVAGVVTYQGDSQRPWRYARYYVRGGSAGPLAETVLVLTPKSPAAKPAPASAAKTHVIDQKDFRFVPETSAIRVGDSVKFTNSDGQVHNVQTFDGDRPFNVNTPIGGEHIQKFDQAGGLRAPFRIGCVYHSQMRAWVFVFAQPFFHVTAEDGRFRWEQVPPGEYDLELVHPAGKLRLARPIVVKAGETQDVTISLSPDNLAEKPEKKP